MQARLGGPDFSWRASDIMPTLLLAAVVVQAARVFDVLTPNASRVSYLIQAATFLLFMGVALLRGRLGLFATGAAVFAYLVFAHMVFVWNTGVHPNFNAIFGQLALVTVVPFALFEASMQRTLQLLALVSVGYLLFYVLGQPFLLSSTLTESGSAVVIGADSARAARVFLAAPFASYVAFYALEERRLHLAIRAALVLLAFAALWLSGSRFYQVAFLVVFLIGLFRMDTPWVRFGLFLLFAAGASALLAGLFLPDWNPFRDITWDDSAWARSREYTVALRAIQQHWILGVGTPTDSVAMAQYLQTPRYEPLFWTDLGVIGPFFQFGIFGLAAFLLATAACITSFGAMFKAPEVRALQLNCTVLGLVGIIAPYLALDPGTVHLPLLLAVFIRRGQAGRRLAVLDRLARRQRPAASGDVAAGGAF